MGSLVEAVEVSYSFGSHVLDKRGDAREPASGLLRPDSEARETEMLLIVMKNRSVRFPVNDAGFE